MTNAAGCDFEACFGRPLAAELRRTRIETLEQFFDISGGDYP